MNNTFSTIIACIGFVLHFYGLIITILLFTTLAKAAMFVGLTLMGAALAYDDHLEKKRRKKAKLPSCNYNR